MWTHNFQDDLQLFCPKFQLARDTVLQTIANCCRELKGRRHDTEQLLAGSKPYTFSLSDALDLRLRIELGPVPSVQSAA